MLKRAYRLGVKLALAEEGLPEGEEKPIDQLTTALQQVPDPNQKGPPGKDKGDGIGDPNDETNYGNRSANYAFDDLSHLGLDIQGPNSTAV